MIKRISKVKFEEMQADLDDEAAKVFLCMHKLLIERHGWQEDELAEEIRRMVQEENKIILESEILKTVNRQNGGVWQ